jgi:hypothetical protein
MTETETKEYIEHRLRSVGWSGKPSFSADAHAAIFRDSDGVPRRINRLCSRVLLACCLDQLTAVDGKLVTQTAQDLARELGAPPDSVQAPPAPQAAPVARQAAPATSAANGAEMTAKEAVNGAVVEQRLNQAEARLDRMETIADRLHAASKDLVEKLRAGPA